MLVGRGCDGDWGLGLGLGLAETPYLSGSPIPPSKLSVPTSYLLLYLPCKRVATFENSVIVFCLLHF